MKTVLILSERNFETAPRIIREIAALETVFNLVLIGSNCCNLPYTNYPIYSLRSFKDKIATKIDSVFVKLKFLKVKKTRFSKIHGLILKKNIDILIIHEPHFIEFAFNLKKLYGITVVFNAHEFHPLEFEDDSKWLKDYGQHFTDLYRTILPHFDLVINVCESIQEKCTKEYGFESLVIPNAAFKNAISPKLSDKAVIRLIHHGMVLPGRNIEKMIEIVSQLGENYQLDIMGVKNPSSPIYYEKIKQICASVSNCNLITPVPFNNIVTFLNTYDIGFYVLEPSSFNNYYALPNKLFEFIQAKLAIVVSPSPEMKRLVEKYEIGLVSEDFSTESMKKTLLSLTKISITQYKQNCIIAAENENSEKYQSILRSQIVSLTE